MTEWKQGKSGFPDSYVLDCGDYEGMGESTISISKDLGYWAVWSEGVISVWSPLGIGATATAEEAKVAAVAKVLGIARFRANGYAKLVECLEAK